MSKAVKFDPSPDSLVREIAVLTIVSIFASVAGTAATMAMFAGLDFSVAVSIGKLWAIGMAISVFAPMVICPVVALPGRRLIADLRRARAELERAASQDSLTGLLNRRGFDALATERLNACQIEGAAAVALMGDIDFFKSINDHYGHDYGDGALERIASMIVSTVGARDAVIGRLGGEEFAIFFPECELAQAERLAGAIRAACETLSIGFGVLSQQVTMSIGIAAVESEDEGLRSLLSRADAALYQAKRDGRNRVVTAPNRKRLSMAA